MTTLVPATTIEPVGEVTGLYGDVLQGWAFDRARPEIRLVVEVYIDGASVALVRADQFQPYSEVSDKFHGFAVKLKQEWLNKAVHIRVRIANCAHVLRGEIKLPTFYPNSACPVASQVWHSGGLMLTGWAWDPQDGNRSVRVRVREGNSIIAQVTADREHHSLTYNERRDHSFLIDLPWTLANGELHVLIIETDLGEELTGSPISLCCWPEGVEALINKCAPVTTDERLRLASAVARHQEVLQPKSAGFRHYPQWLSCFQKPERYISGRGTPNKTGILIISNGDTPRSEISSASAFAQHDKAFSVATSEPSEVSVVILNMLSLGCDSIIPVYAGDRLAAHALENLAPLLQWNVAWAYSDCDSMNDQGERSDPWLKPTWDVDFFIAKDIYTSGAIFSKDIILKGMELASNAGINQKISWIEIVSGIALATEQENAVVLHIPAVLYHKDVNREIMVGQESSTVRTACMNWLVDTLSNGAYVTAIPGHNLLKPHWPLPSNLPKVSILIPTRDQLSLLRTCIEGVLHNTSYPNIEVVIIDNESVNGDTKEYLTAIVSDNVTVTDYPFPFNYAAINNHGAKIATGDFLCLLNNDIEINDPEWLSEMVRQISRDRVGAVGAKLLWPNNMVQHAGVVVGINGLAAHAGNWLHRDDAGYLNYNQTTRKTSAVTAACLVIKKSTYIDLGGQDEIAFPVAFNDVDLCLRVRQRGLDIVWCASAIAIHAESASRGKDTTVEKKMRAAREHGNFISRWTADNAEDLHYHPALSADYLTGPYNGLALPPRKIRPRRNKRPD